MFQQRIDEIFRDMPHVFGIADNIPPIGYDKNDHDYDTILR